MTDNVHALIAEAKARGLQWAINDLRASASRSREYMKQDNVRLDSLQTWASMEVAADALEQLQAAQADAEKWHNLYLEMMQTSNEHADRANEAEATIAEALKAGDWRKLSQAYTGAAMIRDVHDILSHADIIDQKEK